MSQVAANSTAIPIAASSSPANALLSLVAAQASPKAQTNLQGANVADQFKALLDELSGNQTGQSSLTPAQLVNLLKQQASSASAQTDSSQLQVKIQALLAANSQPQASTSGTDPSAALIAQIAGLIQQYPALQQVFTGVSGNVDTQQLQAIGDALAAGGKSPDFSGLQLPDDLKSNLQALTQDPKARSEFQDIAQQLSANPQLAAVVPQALQNFSVLLAQNANKNATANNSLPQAAAPDEDDSNTNAVTANKTYTDIKPRPSGLLKSLASEQQAAPSADDAQAQVSADSGQSGNSSLEAALSGNAKANTDSDSASLGTTQSFFTLTQDAVNAPNLAVNAGNAMLYAGTSNVSLGGAMDAAFNAQQMNSAAAAGNPAVMQVAVQLQRNAQTNNNDFTMQLYPEELGRISVSLKFDGNKVQAKVTADKQETLNYLKQDQGSLTRALNSAGLQTDANSLEFSLGNSSQQQFASQSQQNNTSDQPFGTMLADNQTDETSLTAPGGSQWYTAQSGRVDVKL